MRQRRVQIQLEGVTSFACPIDTDDRGAQEQSLRGFSSSTQVSHVRSWNHSAFVALLRLVNCIHIRLPPWCVGPLVVLGE